MNIKRTLWLGAILALGITEAHGEGMDHGSMQGGAPPPDARDPHAWADGLTLDPSRPLRLADEHHFGSLRVDRLETLRSDGDTEAAAELQAWYGRTYDRAVLKFEGTAQGGALEHSGLELLWGHAVAAYWDTQLGVRYDDGEGPGRGWLALGAQGLAPYWFEVDATAYVGGSGRTAVRLEAEYEALITQQLILQPRFEATAYGKADPARGTGSGLAELSAGLRLRYEFQRELAPYVGIEWSGRFGATADLARTDGRETRTIRVLAGMRFWF